MEPRPLTAAEVVMGKLRGFPDWRGHQRVTRSLPRAKDNPPPKTALRGMKT